MTHAIPCEAEEAAGRMWCGRCHFNWPCGIKPPDCKGKADPPLKFDEMIAVLREQAEIIASSQIALLNAKMRVEPHWPELRKATALRAIAKVLEIVQGDARLIDVLREAM